MSTHSNQRVGAHALVSSTSGVTVSTACTICARLLTAARTARIYTSVYTRYPPAPLIMYYYSSNGVFIRQRGSYIVGYPAARPTYSFIYLLTYN